LRNRLNVEQKTARVVAVDRDLLLLTDGLTHFRARIAGSYRYQHPHAEDQPCVGDWVCTSDNDEFALVMQCLPRYSWLKRKAAGENVDVQMIAANIDVVVVLQSCHQDFNLKRLERYLIMIREGSCEPLIVLTKTDLVSAAELTELTDKMTAAGITAPAIPLSNITRDGLNEFMQTLTPRKTYCFVGSSGVGKSTLVNYLLGRELQSTQNVSGTGEGRHTTVRRELFTLDNGALIIDNPGMREFGVLAAESGIEENFRDITEVAGECRFRNCTHTNEPGCAVREAIEASGISQDHFDHYRKVQEETDFNDLTYAQRRQKDKNFGKMIKDKKKTMRRK